MATGCCMLGGEGVAFSDRLRGLREARGLTQRELAEAIGVSRQAIGLYEVGAREPDLATVQRLAHALRTSISYLVGETDDPSPPPAMVAHREGAEPGTPLDPETQLIIERAIRTTVEELDRLYRRRLEEAKAQRREGDQSGGASSDR